MSSTRTRRLAVLVCLLTAAVDGALGVGGFFNPRVHRARINSRAEDGLAGARKLTQQAASDTTLRVHFEHSVLTRSVPCVFAFESTTYRIHCTLFQLSFSDTSTCHAEDDKVRRGKPEEHCIFPIGV
eukprot:6515232-Pyramimonas_sp.AAC.2